MSKFLYRWGRRAALHPWRMIGAWLTIAVAAVSLNATVGGSFDDVFDIPNTEAQRGIDVLDENFPSHGGIAGQVVFVDPDGDITDDAARSTVAATLDALADGPSVVTVSDPYRDGGATLSAAGDIAYATVRYSDVPGELDGEAALDAVEIARDAGLDAELSRAIVQASEEVEGSETIGLAVALVVLLIAFGSVIAAGIPIGSAVFGILIGLELVGVMSGFTDVPSISPMLASMIGIGVGIDYALFVVTRHRSFLAEGRTPVDAAALANATAGTAVLFAGSTVVVALAGLVIAGIPSVAAMGLASGIAVAVAMSGAVTLLPAFLGLAGDRIDRLRIGRATVRRDNTTRSPSARWADHVGRHPWRFAVGSFVVLTALSAPVLSMRTGVADDGTADPDTTYRRAYDFLADGFGEGFNAPLTIVIDGDQSVTATVRSAIERTAGVSAVSEPAISPNGATSVITAMPTTSPRDETTEQLVHELRDVVVPGAVGSAQTDVYVTGRTAAFIDITDKLSARLPVFLAAVVGTSLLLLLLVFRSVVVPLKAAVMNLLSIGGAYGVVVAVFQWGWGNGLLGVDQTVPISPFLPMIMFAILFGLSMDYEVFLLSRVREEFVRTGDSHQSVVRGLASTAKVITSAALIMVSVFAAFLLTPDVEVKMFAVGLSVAIAIDASIVRMLFVPASMALMGDANWWIPTWLDRLLPNIDVEGASAFDEGYADAPPDIPSTAVALDHEDLREQAGLVDA